MIAMKKFFAIALSAASLCLCLSACDDDDNYWPVPPALTESLYNLYPSATEVKWYRMGYYSVAEFETSDNGSQTDRQAWFDGSGTWYMTATDSSYSQMPQAVQTAFTQSQYSSWTTDDADIIEREGAETLYAVEAVSGSGKSQTDAILFFTQDGFLVRTLIPVPHNYIYQDCLPALLPAAVSAYVQSQYPSARILASATGRTGTELEILDNGVVRTLLFDNSGSWVSTSTQVAETDVPSVVREALLASAYASYTVDDVNFRQTQSGDFYRYILSSNGRQAVVDIAADGSTVTPVN